MGEKNMCKRTNPTYIKEFRNKKYHDTSYITEIVLLSYMIDL